MTIRSHYFRLEISRGYGGFCGELIANGNDGFGVVIHMRAAKTPERAKHAAEDLLTNLMGLFKSRAEFEAIREWVDNSQKP
jgi:hypothetical protein